MNRSCVVVRSIVLPLLMLIVSAAPGAADWHRVDSPNFVVVGDLPGRDLKNVAKKFEGFRETLSRVLSEDVTATAVPTVVIVFPSDRAFTPFKPRYEGKAVSLSGIFVGRPDVNYIGMVYGGEESQRIVFHEYAHLVIANTSRNMPLWLNEGFADYFSTYEEIADGREALIGRTVSNHLLRLNDTRMLPLPELRQVDHSSPHYNERERQSVFYAQSWALTHMLRIGLPDRTRQLVAYLSALAQGRPEGEAWQRAFGGDNLEKALKDYVGQASFRATRYTFRSKIGAFDAPVQKVSSADAEALLSDFLLRMQRPDEAAERLGRTSRAGATGPAPAVVGAALDLARNDEASAERRLLALSHVDDWLTAYFAAVAAADLIERQPHANPVERLAAAERFFQVVRTARGDVPNALAREARLTLRQRLEPSERVREGLERARKLAPGRADYVLLYAEVLARRSAFAASRSVLGALTSTAYPPEVRDTARSLLSYVASLEAAASRRAAGGVSRKADTAPGTPSTPAENDSTPAGLGPPETLQPVFRTTEAGERRTDGLLERIECAANRVTFHVRTRDGAVALGAPTLSGVDFITFRDDLSGDVKCGPLASPMAVYVTVRTSADATDAGVVVAIEFLPK